ncbi:YafY family transcriptional regulator [Ruminococcaceae bacterium OttesenSCG-928-D13]|nr:YafY family transcriptional regulator [Ruminococcaceae bacterium OttesenSCG-928-D13]
MVQRLYEITMLLTQRGQATAEELARRFEVSKRTIYRDIDALSAAGVPVYAERGKGGGIRILPDYVLDKTMFSKDEQAQLVAHFESLSQLGTPDTEPVLDKLAALFGRGERWLEVDFAPWEGGDEMRELFRMLRGAILRRQTVQFGYLSSTQGDLAAGPVPHRRPETRTVDPYRVLFRGQGWYLQAFCHTRGDWRLFKLSRMQNAALTGAHFQPQAEPPAMDMPATTSRHPVVMRFQPEAAFRVIDEFMFAEVEKQPDGGYIVTAVMPTDAWLVGYLLSFGGGVEVLAPPFIRAALAAEVERLHAAYSRPAGEAFPARAAGENEEKP